MRSLKICFLFFVFFLLSLSVYGAAVAFDLSDKNEVDGYFNIYKEYDFMVLEAIREPIYFSVGEKEIAALPLEVSVEGRPYVPHPPKFFLVFTKKNGDWFPVGKPIKKHKVCSLFGQDAKFAFFEAGY